MLVQPLQYEKIHTVREKQSSAFDNQVNEKLSKGWVIISMSISELQSSEYGSSRDIYLVAILGKPINNNLDLKQ